MFALAAWPWLPIFRTVVRTLLHPAFHWRIVMGHSMGSVPACQSLPACLAQAQRWTISFLEMPGTSSALDHFVPGRIAVIKTALPGSEQLSNTSAPKDRCPLCLVNSILYLSSFIYIYIYIHTHIYIYCVYQSDARNNQSADNFEESRQHHANTQQ